MKCKAETFQRTAAVVHESEFPAYQDFALSYVHGIENHVRNNRVSFYQFRVENNLALKCINISMDHANMLYILSNVLSCLILSGVLQCIWNIQSSNLNGHVG